MKDLRFKVLYDGENALIRHEPGFAKKRIEYTAWLDNAGDKQIGLMASLQDLVERGEARQSSSGDLEIGPAGLASLGEAHASQLGLPPATKLALRLNSTGAVTDQDFRITCSWVRGGGIPVKVERNGAILRTGAGAARIPEPTYSIVKTAEPLGDTLDETARYRAYSELTAALSTSLDSNIDVDDYLAGVTIYQASAFSLSLKVEGDSFDFDPVFFGRKEAAEALDDGAALDEEDSALLPPAFQSLFVEDRFRRYADARPAYPLNRGSFLVLDRDLVPAMQVARRVQSDPDPEVRRQFIAQPQMVLKKFLPYDQVDAIDRLFVETEQYSSRVLGIDIWRKPVLAWIKPQPNSWLPEAFGVYIGEPDEGAQVEIAPEDASKIKAQIDAAAQANETSITITDAGGSKVTLPVSTASIKAIGDLADLQGAAEKAAAEKEDTQGAGPTRPASLNEKRFLVIAENHEEVVFGASAEQKEAKPVPPLPKLERLRSTLKPHQEEGVSWLWAGLTGDTGGALLADDMGLGKTLQVLAFIAAARTHSQGPALIVAPTGLLSNWEREVETHFDHNAFPEIVRAYGAGLRELKAGASSAPDIKEGRDTLDTSRWLTASLVFTTYETMRDYHFSFAKIPFTVIAFDEIQKLKNPASQLKRSASTLNARFKVGMTGTPVENRLQDLWSIMDVLKPGFLGASRSFEKEHSPDDAASLDRLKDKLFEGSAHSPSVVLRRMKTETLKGLPNKHEKSWRTVMPAEQASAYASAVANARASKDSLHPRDGMLKVLQQLRMISLHPTHPNSAGTNLDAYSAQSARLSKTIELLAEIRAKQEKALVFVESLDMQAYLATAIQKKFGLEQRPYRINGTVPGPKRQQFVEEFQSRSPGFDVMILSPKAGGVGLTLTAANHVIHLSRWWNPAVEDQSTDRAYRIGQKKDVFVHYPMAIHPNQAIAETSFDLNLDQLLRRKRSLSAHMLVPPENAASDARDLFGAVLGDVDKGAGEGLTVGLAAPTSTLEAIPIEPAAKVSSTLSELEAQRPPARDEITSPTQAMPGPRPRNRRFKKDEAFDFDWFLNGLDGFEVMLARIEDPFCMMQSRNREYTARFLGEIGSRVKALKKVEIVHRRPGRYDNTDAATPDMAVEDFRRKMALVFRGKSIPQTRSATSSEREFHDRWVILTGAIDGKDLKLVFSVGAGPDKLMSRGADTAVSLFEHSWDEL